METSQTKSLTHKDVQEDAIQTSNATVFSDDDVDDDDDDDDDGDDVSLITDFAQREASATSIETEPAAISTTKAASPIDSKAAADAGAEKSAIASVRSHFPASRLCQSRTHTHSPN